MNSSNKYTVECDVTEHGMFISLLRTLELLHKLGMKEPFNPMYTNTNRFFSGPWSKYIRNQWWDIYGRNK